MIQAIRLLGNAVAMGGFMVMFVTFMMVYFDKWGGIDINYYGEANFEFVMLFILLPTVIYAFIYNISHSKMS